jgi:hypothetical protein
MNSSLTRRLSLLAVGVTLVAVAAPSAFAVAVHRYTFNGGNANDSVGTAHGVMVDPAPANHTFTAAGKLDMSGNDGGNPGNNAYLNLPNLIIQGAAQSGTSGALSLEWWFTMSEARTWQRLGDFAGPRLTTPPSGEDVADNGNSSFIYVTSSSGRLNQGVEMSNNYNPSDAADDQTETTYGLGGPTAPALPIGVQHHVVGVWDKNDTDGGVNPGGTMHLYLNGAEILPGAPNVAGSRAINPSLDLNNLGDIDNWLGRAQWGDPAFDGAFNEFTIYDHALSPAEVLTNNGIGPVPVPLPTLIVNTVTGAAAIKNFATGAIDIDYYEISSAGGRLNPATWNSLSDQGVDAGLPTDFNSSGAVDGADLDAWEAGFGTGTTKAQGNADGDGDVDGHDFLLWQRQVGGTAGEGDSWDEAVATDNLLVELFLNNTSRLDADEQISLGNLFRTGGAQDLIFNFGIAGENGLTPGNVIFQTTGPAVGVPEPAGLVIICALGAATLRVRRRGSAGAQR